MTTSNTVRETELLGPKAVDYESVLNFELHNIADLLVTQVVDATGIQVQSVLGTDYSLSIGTGNQATLILKQSIATGERLRIRRISGPRNELSLSGTTLPLPATEDTFDRLAHYHADMLGELDRCVKLSDGELTSVSKGKIDPPDIRKGNFLKYDASTGALTHDPIAVGSAGPQGIAGPATGVQSISGSTGSIVTIAGTGPISTSRSGDVITIDSVAGGLNALSAAGGSTTGSTVAIAGGGIVTTTRAADVITINSTGVTGERVLLTTLSGSHATEARYESIDWPSDYRKLEIEVIGLIPASQARLRFKLWDSAGIGTAYNTNCSFVSVSQTSGGNAGQLETEGADAATLGYGNVFETNALRPVDHVNTMGINGSIIFTNVSGNTLMGFGEFQYIFDSGSNGDSLCGVTTNTGLTIPIATGTLDGFQVEMRDHSVVANDTASVVAFTGIVKVWGHLN